MNSTSTFSRPRHHHHPTPGPSIYLGRPAVPCLSSVCPLRKANHSSRCVLVWLGRFCYIQATGEDEDEETALSRSLTTTNSPQ